MIRIAQFSDLHYSEKHLTEADRCFTYAIDRAIAMKIDAAVISGDATDHALDVHAPAVERLARNVRRLADHCLRSVGNSGVQRVKRRVVLHSIAA